MRPSVAKFDLEFGKHRDSTLDQHTFDRDDGRWHLRVEEWKIANLANAA